ncbi:FAD-dependent oxidoreductase [Termitidicoccus mucosus]
MSLRQASGVAVALAVRADAPVQEIDVTRLREILRRQKQVIGLAL